MRLKIEKLVYGGSGLARTDEGVVFVPRTAPGDVIEAEIVERKKDYSVARMIELLEPSPDRQPESSARRDAATGSTFATSGRSITKNRLFERALSRLGHVQWNGSHRPHNRARQELSAPRNVSCDRWPIRFHAGKIEHDYS